MFLLSLGPCLMRLLNLGKISIIQIFDLCYFRAIFFHKFLAFFGPKNRSNEINSPKNSLAKYLLNALKYFSNESRIRRGSHVQFYECAAEISTFSKPLSLWQYSYANWLQNYAVIHRHFKIELELNNFFIVPTITGFESL